MSRVQIPVVAQDAAGNAVSGASVTIVNRQTGQAPTVYTTETGGTARSLPLTTGANGRPPESWVDRAAYLFTVSAAAIGTDGFAWDASSARDASVDVAWLSTALRPSQGAAAGAEALRAIGPDAGQVAAGVHAAAHATGGGDVLAPEQIGAVRKGAKAFLSTIGIPLDAGGAHYQAGSASGWVYPSAITSVPAADITATITGTYPLEYLVRASTFSYAGVGTQFLGLNLARPNGTFLLDEGIEQRAHGYGVIQLAGVIPVSALVSGAWRLRMRGSADGVRSAGYRLVTLILRERQDLA
jgi:hypothetical protein